MPKSTPSLALLVLVFAASPYLHSQGNVLTWHNDNSRTGVNSSETSLTLSNVNPQKFGKVAFFSTDGAVDAQPLYVSGLKVNGATRNVLFVATEQDYVYAKQADTGEWLWKTSLLKSGETFSDDRGCDQIPNNIGVTSTPVIDLSKGPHGAIYVVSMSKDSSGKYHQRINALDLVTGAQLFGGPTEITASYPGSGENSSNGKVTFDPAQYAERAALLEWNGAIYTTWTSHCDDPPYTGWLIGYDASTLKQTSVLNFTPNGDEGSIWMSGAGPAAYGSRMFLVDANGSFDTALDSSGFPGNKDFGNAAIVLSQNDNGLYVSDYYTTDTTVQQSNTDTDFGSGGILLLPTLTDSSGVNHVLAVAAGKDHNIYLMDRYNMGKYHPGGGYVYQVLSQALPNGEWGAPAYFDNKIYYGGVQDNLKAFSISKAKLDGTPASHSARSFVYPGTIPSISSNASSDAIVWALSHDSSPNLYAYNAANLSDQLYSSTATRDQFGHNIGHFVTPMIAGGRVYVGTDTGVVVFGLLGE